MGIDTRCPGSVLTEDSPTLVKTLVGETHEVSFLGGFGNLTVTGSSLPLFM